MIQWPVADIWYLESDIFSLTPAWFTQNSSILSERIQSSQETLAYEYNWQKRVTERPALISVCEDDEDAEETETQHNTHHTLFNHHERLNEEFALFTSIT